MTGGSGTLPLLELPPDELLDDELPEVLDEPLLDEDDELEDDEPLLLVVDPLDELLDDELLETAAVLVAVSGTAADSALGAGSPPPQPMRASGKRAMRYFMWIPLRLFLPPLLSARSPSCRCRLEKLVPIPVAEQSSLRFSTVRPISDA